MHDTLEQNNSCIIGDLVGTLLVIPMDGSDVGIAVFGATVSMGTGVKSNGFVGDWVDGILLGSFVGGDISGILVGDACIGALVGEVYPGLNSHKPFDQMHSPICLQLLPSRQEL